MRSLGTAALALTMLVGGLSATTAVALPVARADDRVAPSQQGVEQVERAVRERATDVDTVRAQLAVAQHRLDRAGIEAARAAEAWNGARYRARAAREAVRRAERAESVAERDLARQREVYGDALTTSYQLAPALSSLAALTQPDGIEAVLDRTATVRNATDALDGRYDELRAATTLAAVAGDQAAVAQERADAAAADARAARDDAAGAAQAAADEAVAVAAERDALVADLARLQGVSVELAAQQQAALEQEAGDVAVQAAELAAVPGAAGQSAASAAPAGQPDVQAGSQAETQATTPQAAPQPQPQPQPAPPAPSSGAQAAIAFARAQLGEPYVWGGAGPSSWDCSGLTSAAWRRGGKSLPHYSVAQYQQSTPISAGRLRPGDLVFWSDGGPSSIYHVALYTGNGRIIHAPRTGRPVVEESMWAWPPDLFARP